MPVDAATFVEGSISRILRAVTPLDSSQLQLHGKPYGTSWLTPATARYSAVGGRFEREVLSDLAPALRPAYHNRIDLRRMANNLAVLSNLLR